MALYAFDGTWNVDEPGEGQDSNVVKFIQAYDGKTYYLEGVGTKAGFVGKILGGVTGAGGRLRIREMTDALKNSIASGDHDIDIIGFSRGAALALHFANTVRKETDDAPVRFLGLWDVVASFGLPGNRIDIGWDLTLPDNVQHCFHAMALDERRGNFPLTRIKSAKSANPSASRLEEVWFRGVHSDVGGGMSTGLSSISLCWMLSRARRCNIQIKDDEFVRYQAQCDPAADISKNFDPKLDKKRQILLSDSIHESVDPRGDIGGKEHNDPPNGLKISYDNA